MIRRLLKPLGDGRGFSAAEFALVLPILVLFSVGTVEYSRLILLTQKLQSGAFILADLTARDKTLSTAQLGNIFLAIDQVIAPVPVLRERPRDRDERRRRRGRRSGRQLAVQRSRRARRRQRARQRRRQRRPSRRSRHRVGRDDHRRRGLLRLRAAVRDWPFAARHPARRLLPAAARRSRDNELPGLNRGRRTRLSTHTRG